MSIAICNFIEYNDNYSDTSGSLWQFKRDEPPADSADLDVNDNKSNSQSFEYKASFVEKAKYVVNDTNSSVKKHKNCCSIKAFE